MNENINNPGKEYQGTNETEQQNDELDIGNDMSVGSENGSEVSDFEADEDQQETPKKEQPHSGSGDNQLSGDNGINPSPVEVIPQNTGVKDGLKPENAAEDNSYPTGLRPDKPKE